MSSKTKPSKSKPAKPAAAKKAAGAELMQGADILVKSLVDHLLKNGGPARRQKEKR